VPGQGSEFQVRLPVTMTAGDASIKSADTPSSPPGTFALISANALIVEDNPVNMLVLSALLEKFGLNVTGASNGIEALEFLEQIPVDIVFMDCQMPDMDGFETTQRLRAGNGPNHNIPVLAVTANAMSRDIERCFEAGMDDHVKKPIDRQILHAKIQRLLALNLNGNPMRARTSNKFA